MMRLARHVVKWGVARQVFSPSRQCCVRPTLFASPSLSLSRSYSKFWHQQTDRNLEANPRHELFSLIESGDLFDIELLMDTINIDIDSFDEHGRTALMLAVEKNKPDVVQFLLDRNANPFLWDFCGDTAYSLSLKNDATDAQKVLSDHLIDTFGFCQA